MFQKLLFIVVPLLTLAGCLQAAEDPRDVANQYWQALKNGDTEAARSLVSSNSQQAFDNYLAAPADEKTAIGEVNLGTQQTTVITIIYPEGGAPDDFKTFDTVMVLEDGQWKIDVERTIIPRPAPSDRELEQLKDQLSESMEKNLESVEEAMNEGLKLLDEALREGSKDMGESMLKGMEEMNRALRESIEEMQKRREEGRETPEGEGLI
jgi:hypothetical protein